MKGQTTDMTDTRSDLDPPTPDRAQIARSLLPRPALNRLNDCRRRESTPNQDGRARIPRGTRAQTVRFSDRATASWRGFSDLTDRELEVLRVLASGLNNREIANALYIGEATVKTHVGRVFAKLGVRDRVQAVVFAYEVGVVSPSRPASRPHLGLS